MAQLGRKPLISHEETTFSDYLVNFYDSECTLLFFLVESYFLNEQGTHLVTEEQEKKLIDVLD
jgi:hypothetical protein